MNLSNRIFLFNILLLAIFLNPLKGYWGFSSLLSNENPTIDAILDIYEYQMGTYSEWRKVNSIKKTGVIVTDEEVFEISIYNKLPDLVKVIIQKKEPKSPKFVQVVNEDGIHSYLLKSNGEIELKEPLLDLSDDRNIMPNLMHLKREEYWETELTNANDAFFEVTLSKENTNKVFRFSIDKKTMTISEQLVSEGDKLTKFSYNGLIQSDRLKFYNKITVYNQDGKVELVFSKFQTNLGIANSFFDLPQIYKTKF